MLNYREIFNPTYGYIGVIIILLLFGVLLIINKNLRESLKLVANIIITSACLNIFLVIIFKIFITLIIDYNFRIFIEVISDTLISNLLTKALIEVVLGVFLFVIYKYLPNISLNSNYK